MNEVAPRIDVRIGEASGEIPQLRLVRAPHLKPQPDLVPEREVRKVLVSSIRGHDRDASATIGAGITDTRRTTSVNS